MGLSLSLSPSLSLSLSLSHVSTQIGITFVLALRWSEFARFYQTKLSVGNLLSRCHQNRLSTLVNGSQSRVTLLLSACRLSDRGLTSTNYLFSRIAASILFLSLFHKKKKKEKNGGAKKKKKKKKKKK